MVTNQALGASKPIVRGQDPDLSVQGLYSAVEAEASYKHIVTLTFIVTRFTVTMILAVIHSVCYLSQK